MEDEDDLVVYGDFVPRTIGYTTAIARLKWFRTGLAQHRKVKRTWNGTQEAYEQELEHLMERVEHYKNLLMRPDYAAKVREAKLRKRRKNRKPLPTRQSANHLAWMVLRIKKKRFKTVQHLAYVYKRSVQWVEEAKATAIKQGLITEVEWRSPSDSRADLEKESREVLTRIKARCAYGKFHASLCNAYQN